VEVIKSFPSEELKEASQHEKDLARQALRSGHHDSAWKYLRQALSRLSSHSLGPAGTDLFVPSALEFSNLSFALGKGFNESVKFLQIAHNLAEESGDRRSRALIKMHLGRYYYFSERRHEALELLANGKEEVEELGDEDILTRAAEFLGFFYHIQGLFVEAMPHFERAARIYESEETGRILSPSGPMWLAYCAAYLGHFHQAIGTLNYYRTLALQRRDLSMAATIRAVLGVILLIIKKKDDASYHLCGALQEALKTQNDMALYFAQAGLAYHQFLEGHPREARDLLEKAFEKGAKVGLIRQYTTPHPLEELFEFNRLGLEPIPQFSFQKEVNRILGEPNIHLRGVALRLRAMDRVLRNVDGKRVEGDLIASEQYLVRSNDPIQLAKTRIEIARFELRRGNQEKALFYAQKAWQAFSGYWDEFYPDDLRTLLALKTSKPVNERSREELVERFLAMIQDLVPSAHLEELMTRLVLVTNRFFGAERGGLFWYARTVTKTKPTLRAACNLTQDEVFAEDFRSNLALVFKAYRENRPQVFRLDGSSNSTHKVKAILCLPFEVEGQTRGVIYHDNSYLNDCFDFLENQELVRVANSLTNYISRIHGYCQRLEQVVAERITQSKQAEQVEILANSPVMYKILAQVDRIAPSDSTVLILGETGVGKELLAHRLHAKSERRERPLVVVDPSTIPENLVESELFGHEKGAFTGADSRKRGRLEMADRGTLFIDEVGEIPMPIQVKLLRAVEKKTLIRLGGISPISSDFRLVAATNRDLGEEVAAGRFRKDLYYRLSVVPITLPPLRERIEDVPLLAHHFLRKYTAKYNRPGLRLSQREISRLMDYHWPGNIRELQNVIERAVLLSTDESLELNFALEKHSSLGYSFADNPTLDELQRRYIQYALEKTGGKVGGPRGAAEFLGMKRTTLQKRMKKLGLTWNREAG